MNTKTARLIKRHVAVSLGTGNKLAVRHAKRDWNRTPRPKRAALRRRMRKAINEAKASQ